MATRVLPQEERMVRLKLLLVMDYIRKITLTGPRQFKDEDYRRVDRQLCSAGAALSTMIEQMQDKQEYCDWLRGHLSDIDTFGRLRAEKALEFLDRGYANLRRVGLSVRTDNAPTDVLCGTKLDATQRAQREQANDPSWFRHGLGRETLFDARDKGVFFPRISSTSPATSQTASVNLDELEAFVQRQEEDTFRAYVSSIDFDAGPTDDDMFADSAPTEPTGPLPQLARPLQSAPTNDADTVEYLALVKDILRNISAFMNILQTWEEDHANMR